MPTIIEFSGGERLVVTESGDQVQNQWDAALGNQDLMKLTQDTEVGVGGQVLVNRQLVAYFYEKAE